MCSCALCEEKKPVRALRVRSRIRVRNSREDVSSFFLRTAYHLHIAIKVLKYTCQVHKIALRHCQRLLLSPDQCGIQGGRDDEAEAIIPGHNC